MKMKSVLSESVPSPTYNNVSGKDRDHVENHEPLHKFEAGGYKMHVHRRGNHTLVDARDAKTGKGSMFWGTRKIKGHHDHAAVEDKIKKSFKRPFKGHSFP
jgi:hypothetical protein